MLLVNKFNPIARVNNSNNKSVNTNNSRQIMFQSKPDMVSFTSDSAEISLKVKNELIELAENCSKKFFPVKSKCKTKAKAESAVKVDGASASASESESVVKVEGEKINSSAILREKFNKEFLTSLNEFLEEQGLHIEVEDIGPKRIQVTNKDWKNTGVVNNYYNAKLLDKDGVEVVKSSPYTTHGLTAGQAKLLLIKNIANGNLKLSSCNVPKAFEFPSKVINVAKEICFATDDFLVKSLGIEVSHQDYNAKAKNIQDVLDSLIPTT